MGTSLTGTKPKDTYDSLIKVTDNGPLSGTAKYLSDGLGNDSALAVSTSAVGVGTASPNAPLEVQADSGGTSIRVKARAAANSGTIRFFDNASSTQLAKIESSDNGFEIGSVNNVYAAFLTNGTERMRIASAGNVGIGTITPQAKLDATKAGKATIAALDTTAFAAGVGGSIDLGGTYRSVGDFQAFTRIAAEKSNATDGNFGYDLGFYVTTNGGSTQGTKVATMTSTGVIDLAQGQIKFPATQVASADPNTLDDYEEGTFTPTLGTGGDTSGMVYSAQLGEYTKIGNLVNVRIAIFLTTLGGAAGDAYIYGLPFANGSTRSVISAATIFNATALMDNVTLLLVGSSNFVSFLKGNTSTGISKADLTNTTEIFFNVTYRV